MHNSQFYWPACFYNIIQVFWKEKKVYDLWNENTEGEENEQ